MNMTTDDDGGRFPSDFKTLPLDRRHNNAMLDILHQSPIKAGGFSICFDRQPDIFALAELKYSPPVWCGFFEGDELAGFALLGNHQAYVNGCVTPVMHITDCYIRPQSRGRGYLSAALPFFLGSQRCHASIGYAVVMKGNRAAEAQLGNKLAYKSWDLQIRIIAELAARNILFSFRLPGKPTYGVRTARMDDIDAIVALLRTEHSNRLFGLVTDRDLFAARLKNRPRLSIDNYYVIEHGSQLIGVCAAWDAYALKQNRVVQYGPWFGAIRSGVNILSSIMRIPTLPAPGESFRDIVITDWAVRERSVELLHALLKHIYNIYYGHGYHSMIVGSCAGDPILEATKGFIRTEVSSDIALFSIGESWLQPGAIQKSLPFIDIAFL
jgi:hypothetical protein